MKQRFLFCHIYFIILLIYSLLSFSISFNKLNNMNNHQFEVNLVIKGNNNRQNLVSQLFYLTPSEVIINGVKKEDCSNRKYCYLANNVLNNVTIKFNKNINSCKSMFDGLENIIEIDLSNLDISQVTTMENMFNNCKNIIKIDFGNINTSLVTSMKYMFRECNSLTFINVSKFNTSKVETMEDMFSLCRKLKAIDVSSFDTSNVISMLGMFNDCNELVYADLSNFKTDSLTDIQCLFCHDKKLIYVNLGNFSLLYTLTEDPFSDTPSNLKICIKNEDLKSFIKRKYNDKNYTCSDDCFMENIKIDLKINQCINSCNESQINKFQYYNLCFDQCPDKTYSIINNNNENFCSDNIPEEGYYLYSEVNNNKIYKECYEACKTCIKEGNGANNNCILCKPNYKFLIDQLNNSNCVEECPENYKLIIN